MRWCFWLTITLVTHGNQPGENQGIAPETAAADLRASLRTDRKALGASGGSGIFAQVAGLGVWAETQGRWLDPELWLRPAIAGGQEHELWFDESWQRYVKITHPGFYGQYPVPRPDGTPGLRPATPLEYLDRLALSNDLFADDWQVEGVLDHPAGARLVTSQPVVVGERPTDEQVDVYLRALEFERIPGKSYFASLPRSLAVFDGHNGNFLRGRSGQIFAIDVIPVPLTAELWRAMEAARKI